ncbi:Signal transduction histidine kinase [Paenibacillus sp. 1_12]|uniref:sensor histidine kinase n=1 Tax=Paenibacillus sp. 1_12 TaxID=1566278 RepID=UPI0008EE82F3|nr:HAMP domain-containing sensor histidine kinase [Paenibacillus sp. 1_12]SFL22791.1 Signal transduction histidine kinase [Paenibacillus sp. 1_12]
MNNEYVSIMSSHKAIISQRWLQEVREIYPDLPLDSAENINNYLDYIMNLEIPADNHPIFNSIPKWSKISLDQYNYIEYILITTNIWRKIILETVEQVAIENEIAIYQLVKKYIFRMDLFEKHARENYWNLTRNVILEKDKQINELHSERLALIGKMAASMAHEIRNPLTSIQGFLKLIKQNVSSEMNRKVAEYIKIIDDEFDSINMQITGFLSFSRNREHDESYDNISITEIINSVLSMINPRLIQEDVVFVKKFKNDKMLRVQKKGIQQVISNLLNNAVDALLEVSHKRKITLSLKEDDDHVYLYISNNGPKISDEIKDLLFIPFVTNKSSGTGLGLMICKQIMQKNDGDILFDTNEKETTFILSFKKAGT